MGFKRTTDGRVFFSGSNETANDETTPITNQPIQKSSAVPKPATQDALDGAAQNQTQLQVLQLLKALNERLKTTQAERNFMRKQLEDYRGVIENLQKQTGNNEKAYKALEEKITKSLSVSSTGSSNAQTEEFIRDTLKEMEKTRRALLTLESKTERADQAVSTMKKSQQAQAQKIAKTGSEFTKLSHRLASQEEKQNLLNDRIDQAIAKQEKIAKRVEDALEERERFMRKIERIEETVIQTRDALNSRAVMLMGEAGAADAEGGASLGKTLQLQNEKAVQKFEDPLKPASAHEVYESKQFVKDSAFFDLDDDDDDINVEIKDITPQEEKPQPEATKPEPTQTTSQPAFASTNKAPKESYTPRESFKRPEWLTTETALIPGMFFIAVAAGLFIGATTRQDPVKRPLAEQPVIEQSAETSETSATDATNWTIEEDTSAFAAPKQAEPLARAPAPFPDELKAVGLESEEQMVQMFEEDNEELGARINAVEPGEQVEELAEATPVEETPAAAPVQEIKEEPPVVQEVAKAEPAKSEPVQEALKKDSAPKGDSGAVTADPNLPSAIQKVEAQAMAGSPEAQHDLGAIYIAGHGGVERNLERAVMWFEKAAAQGIANASYNLGVLYHQGMGVEADLDKAIEWYKKAASQNHPEAQYNLGIAYIEGIGVPYKPEQAVTHFKQAAESGVVEAAYNLGLIYENGLLGQPQPKDALMWYKSAADAGNKEAQTALELLAKAIGVSLDDVNRIADDVAAPAAAAPENATPALEQTSITPSATSRAPAPDEIIAAPAQDDIDPMAQVEKEFEQILVGQVQEQLMRLGLYPGPADGVIGPLTGDAIRTYQSKNNLRVDGQATAELLAHMTETAAGTPSGGNN